MTMPERIYVGEGAGFEGDDILIADVMDWREATSSYIRKDLADDLARALDLMFSIDDCADPMYTTSIAMAIYLRYKKATEGK